MADNERRNKLKQTMKDFNKKHKSPIFTMGNEIEDTGVISTGLQKVDDFLGGGFKRSAHTIFWGGWSVGKTAFILTAIANAQKEGLICCYVNTEKPIERERFEFFGIDLTQMIYIEAPEQAEYALEAVRTLCKDKVIDLFIIDSTNGLCPKSVQETNKGAERSLAKNNVASLPKTLSNFYNVVTSHIYRSKASVIWIGQQRTKGIGGMFAFLGLTGGNAQLFFAYQIIKMNRGEKDNNPIDSYKEYYVDPEGKVRFKTVKEPCGFPVVFKMEKTNSSKSAGELKTLEIPYFKETGFYPCEEKQLPFKIDGTKEEKAKITAHLIKKGIIESDLGKPTVVLGNKKEDHTSTDNKTVTTLSPDENDIIVDPIKRKRGRPKKEK